MQGAIVKSPISSFVVAISLGLIAAVGAGAATEGEAKRRPVVAVTSETPVVVVGRNFRGRERIRLRLFVGSRQFSRTLRATAAGRFSATFTQADASCDPFTIIAMGGGGSRATQTRRFNIPPPCGIAPQP